MIFNLKKFNAFFEGDKYDQEIKDFVLKIYDTFFSNSVDILTSKYLLLDLGFYDLSKEDIEDQDSYDLYIIDFYRLISLNPVFRTNVMILLLKYAKEEYVNEFYIDMISEDLKILIVYEDWKISRRRNKLDNLDNLNK
jgi:hypothetical protein